MQRADVVIVGGGPAGSSCARALCRAGLDAVILDRKTFPRDKTCAGWVTPPVIDILEIDLSEYASGRVLQPITGFCTGLIGGEPVETRYGEVVSYGIRRFEFDHYLLERSRARQILGQPLRMAVRANGLWTLNDEIQTPLLIGAGGHFCPVARMLGGPERSLRPLVTAKEVEFEVPPDARASVGIDGEIPELYFCRDLGGYGWCFRKGDYLNIGLGRVDSEGLTQQTAEFCDFLREARHLRCEIPAAFHGHAYQLYERSPPKLIDDGVLLIGDAAGFAYPQSGEGIRPAIESGLLAADAIVKADGQYDVGALGCYAEHVSDRFGVPRTASASNWLPVGWLEYLAGKLLESHWFSKHVVLDRWFLHRQQQALSIGS